MTRRKGRDEHFFRVVTGFVAAKMRIGRTCNDGFSRDGNFVRAAVSAISFRAFASVARPDKIG
jgi:hypothetical protein